MASVRSKRIKAAKAAANARGHDMGNVVNVSPTWPSAAWAVRSRCKNCGRHLTAEGVGAKVYVHDETNTCGVKV